MPVVALGVMPPVGYGYLCLILDRRWKYRKLGGRKKGKMKRQADEEMKRRERWRNKGARMVRK